MWNLLHDPVIVSLPSCVLYRQPGVVLYTPECARISSWALAIDTVIESELGTYVFVLLIDIDLMVQVQQCPELPSLAKHSKSVQCS